MQEAETVLNVIRERGTRGLPLENIYRLLHNRVQYLRAYSRIYSNQGATTKGITAETVDGMSLAKIDRIINALRYERFRWTPVRRVNIPKPNGKTRALGIPTGPAKLLQAVIRMILPITSRSSPTTLTASGPTGDATPPWAQWSGSTYGATGAPRSQESVSRVWPAAGYAYRQRPALCQRGPWGSLGPVGMVDQAGNHAGAYRAGSPGAEWETGAISQDPEGGYG